MVLTLAYLRRSATEAQLGLELEAELECKLESERELRFAFDLPSSTCRVQVVEFDLPSSGSYSNSEKVLSECPQTPREYPQGDSETPRERAP